jgi:Zn-dependent M28 family amino/carboxypeptidase
MNCRIALWILLSFVPFGATSQNAPPLSSIDQFQAEFSTVPCKNKMRLESARNLFEKMGASPSEVAVEKLGAHYDFVDAGCGAIDNWSGVVVMAHAYRTIRQIGTRKTVSFVAFGNEEKGLLGSRAMARAIPKVDLPQYCAMINIDSFGLGGPFTLRNVSSAKLSALVVEQAKALNIPYYDYYEIKIDEADADSHSFLDRNIPAVTLSGLARNWKDFLHTKNDQASAVNAPSVYWGYRLVLSTWSAVDQASCDTLRESTPAPQRK